MATASLVLGILGFLPFCALIAIILGFVARSRIAKQPGMTGAGKALAGIILGFVWIAASIAYYVAVGMDALES